MNAAQFTDRVQKSAIFVVTFLLVSPIQPTALAEAVTSSTQGVPTCVQWESIDIHLSAAEKHPWWSFPVEAEFVHSATSRRIRLPGFWFGGNSWCVRFVPTIAGDWSYRTYSTDKMLDGVTGTVHARASTDEEIAANPNRRGHVRVSQSGRFFEYADGTPCLLLADTLWAGNTTRCGLGQNSDGPFFEYLDDRCHKEFTAILMRYLNGFGDEPRSPRGDRNEGGRVFIDGDSDRLNADYFIALDRRLAAISERGLISITPVNWWGKTSNRFCPLQFEIAKRLCQYCAARYGAFNSIWCLSGEYQYAFRDCKWSSAQFNELGLAVQKYNLYRHPLSVHPSSSTHWKPPHNCQSSKPFHNEPWLDHNWLQTGQSADRMYNIVGRAAENRSLIPTKPVFCSESFYEFLHDADSAYPMRWQAWVAMLNGCAGYGYGARGVWQFYDPDDAEGETGKKSKNTVPWRVAIDLPGSADVGHVNQILREFEWWRLAPQFDALRLDGKPCPSATALDITPPHCGIIPGKLYIIYVPRGNGKRSISLQHVRPAAYEMCWFDPRSGKQQGAWERIEIDATWPIPQRPSPVSEDWVLVLKAR